MKMEAGVVKDGVGCGRDADEDEDFICRMVVEVGCKKQMNLEL